MAKEREAQSVISGPPHPGPTPGGHAMEAGVAFPVVRECARSVLPQEAPVSLT